MIVGDAEAAASIDLSGDGVRVGAARLLWEGTGAAGWVGYAGESTRAEVVRAICCVGEQNKIFRQHDETC